MGSVGTETQTTLYIGSVEKITKADGSKQIKRTIGGIAIETEEYNSSDVLTAQNTNYLYKDHLGSIDVITDATGQIASNGGEMSFDAWGQRRDAISWQDVNEAISIAGFGVFSNPITTRGFTGHEMVDEVGIIHMNGRIYDPKLGRFLQADSILQAPYDTQMLNRYSYVRNNPLNATDPSGHIIPFVVAAIQIAATIGGITGAITVGTAMAISFAAGFVGALAMGGSIGDAFLSGVSGAAFTGLGVSFGLAAKAAGGVLELSLGTVLKYAGAFAVTGGMTAALQGGKFGNGFVTAGVSFVVGATLFAGIESQFLRTVSQMTLAGTLSDTTGGKFANGAVMAAFGAVVGAGVRSTYTGNSFMGGVVDFFKDIGTDFAFDFGFKEMPVGVTWGEEINYVPYKKAEAAGNLTTDLAKLAPTNTSPCGRTFCYPPSLTGVTFSPGEINAAATSQVHDDNMNTLVKGAGEAALWVAPAAKGGQLVYQGGKLLLGTRVSRGLCVAGAMACATIFGGDAAKGVVRAHRGVVRQIENIEHGSRMIRSASQIRAASTQLK